MNYHLLYDGDIFSTNIKELISKNRNLPPDWCSRTFNERPSFDFIGLQSAASLLLQHIKLAENDSGAFHQKFQIIVDSDIDGICSAAILYKFIREFYPKIEIEYSIHSGKQHGLSSDIKISDDTTLVLIPDAGSNDIEQCKKLRNRFIDVICLDHHVIDQINPYASIVNCMDGVYPNQNLCGTAVTWLFLYGFCFNCVFNSDEHRSYLLKMLDLVATATISDLMYIADEGNMYFVQQGLNAINSNILKAFLLSAELNLNDITINDIRFKVSPQISSVIRIGSSEEKHLLFRAFIDDYEEFDYEKRGSISVETETIYDRVVRLCKNAKSRQDRAKQKLLEECKIHEFPHILLVEYQAPKTSTLTGLVANELANKYCKPCIVYRNDYPYPIDVLNREIWFSGSARNYEGSPINNLKQLLSEAFDVDGVCAGHANAFGVQMVAASADSIGNGIEDYFNSMPFSEPNNSQQSVKIGERVHSLDFFIHADNVDGGFIKKLHFFEHFTGAGFSSVTALITGIKVRMDNFITMGKNTFNWKIYNNDNGVTYIKFRVDKEKDDLVQRFDNINFDFNDIECECVIDAICTFGINNYNGEIHPQAIVQEYEVVDVYPIDNNDDDLDLVL